MSSKIFRKINKLLERGEKFAVATIVKSEGSSPRDAGAKMIILEDGEDYGSVGGDLAERAVKEAALEALEEEEPKSLELKLDEEEGEVDMKCGGEIEVSIEILRPSPKVFLIGSGRVAAAVAELADEVGFEVTVIDPFVDESEFPESSEVISESVEDGMSEVDVTPQSYIVIITRHKYDEPALLESLDTDASYIGLMGSENRVRSIFEELEEERGIDKEVLSRVNAPIGLDIGAEKPKEIAVSIVGELIKERRNPGSSGGSLKIDY